MPDSSSLDLLLHLLLYAQAETYATHSSLGMNFCLAKGVSTGITDNTVGLICHFKDRYAFKRQDGYGVPLKIAQLLYILSWSSYTFFFFKFRVFQTWDNLLQDTMKNTQSVALALGRLNQEDQEFEASLDYIVNPKPAWTAWSVVTKQTKGCWGDGSAVSVRNGRIWVHPRFHVWKRARYSDACLLGLSAGEAEMGDPWNPLASQPSLTAVHQARDRTCLLNQGGQLLKNDTWDWPLSTCTYTHMSYALYT